MFSKTTTLLLVCIVLSSNAYSREVEPFDLPEFHTQSTQHWLNSAPITTAALRGKVVLLDFWTFDCWNCYRSFPWLNKLEASYRDKPFQVIGVHTPEFAHEKVRENIEAKIAEFNLHHPVVMDNEFKYWRALRNKYWPAFYLVDKQGRVRYFHAGEVHAGDATARSITKEIDLLLAE